MSETEVKRSRTRTKKKRFVPRSNAICMVAYTQNGAPIPADLAEYVETVVNNATVEAGLLVSVTRS